MSKRIKSLLIKIVTGVLMFLSIIPGVVQAAPGDTVNKVIMLDMAHKDTINDVGAQYKQFNERDIVNTITEQVGAKLEARGYKIIYTRPKDQSLSIGGRQQKAWSTEYDYYISLHANSSANGKGEGVEGFYRGSTAAKLNETVLKNLSKEFNMTYRRNEESPYYNRKIQDSTIIELGFINNESDLNILLNSQDKISDIVVNSILEQYGEAESTKEVQVNSQIDKSDIVQMGDGTYIHLKK